MRVLAVDVLPNVGRQVDVDRLVGASDIADRVGVKRLQVVHHWRRRHADFPKPVTVVSRALIWYCPNIERWARGTGHLT